MVTVTSTDPELPAGAVQLMDVLLTTTTLVAGVVPNATVAPETKPVPDMVTVVPPTRGPAVGVRAVTVGTGR